MPPSDDALAKALLRTAEYRPDIPSAGFVDFDAARWTSCAGTTTSTVTAGCATSPRPSATRAGTLLAA